MNTSQHILVASPEIESRRMLVAVLNEEGLSTISVSRVRDCQDVLTTRFIRLVFCEPRLSDGNYRDVLAAARGLKHQVRVVVTSRLADWIECRDALREGAFDHIASPCHPTDVLRVLLQVKHEEAVASRVPTHTEPKVASEAVA
jgi:DNA-binding NtrC family response regulator